jgi:hypothetical protein
MGPTLSRDPRGGTKSRICYFLKTIGSSIEDVAARLKEIA